MALLPIYNCYHPVLKKKTEPVKEIDDSIKKLVDDMFDTIHKAEGLGLAANQVGISKSLLVIDIPYFKSDSTDPVVAMINPEIITFSDESWDYEEGCLSVPSLHEVVTRPKLVQVRFYDVDMKEQTLEADNLMARVIQHEIDHLNGILFFERISPVRRTLAKSRLRKIQKGQVKADYPMILPDGRLVEP